MEKSWGSQIKLELIKLLRYHLICCRYILKHVFAYLCWMLLGNTCLYFDGYFIFVEILWHSVKHLTPKTNKHRASKMDFRKHLKHTYYVTVNSCEILLPMNFLLTNMFTNIDWRPYRKGILFILFSWVLVMWMPKLVIWSLCFLSGNTAWCSTVQH